MCAIVQTNRRRLVAATILIVWWLPFSTCAARAGDGPPADQGDVAAPPISLLHAVQTRNHDAIATFLQTPDLSSIDFDARTENGFGVLHYASYAGNATVVRSLLAVMPDTLIDAVDIHGDSALHLAAVSQHAETVALLLAAGADPCTKTNGGMTVLDMALASGSGHEPIVRLLNAHRQCDDFFAVGNDEGGFEVTIGGAVHALPPLMAGRHRRGAAAAHVDAFCDEFLLLPADCTTLQKSFASWLRDARSATAVRPADDVQYYEHAIARQLAQAVRASGMPLEGNAMYHHEKMYHHDSDLKPNQSKKRLRANLHTLGMKARRILEIGFNAGHSNFLFLFENAKASIVNFDLCVHAYTRPCFDVLKATGADVELVCGDSLQALPMYDNAGAPPFDLVHIDGGHGNVALFHDLVNAKRLSGPDTLVVIDDTILNNIQEVLAVVEGARFIEEVDYASLGLHEVEGDHGVVLTPQGRQYPAIGMPGSKVLGASTKIQRHRVFRYVFDVAAPHYAYGETGDEVVEAMHQAVLARS